MIPVDQEFLHEPDKGVIGDCQRAVFASLLELPITEVPHFGHLAHVAGDTDVFWEGIQTWLGTYGLAYLSVPARVGSAFYGLDGDVYHDISGPSPRSSDYWHAVVGKDETVMYDPHPSRQGLDGDPSLWTHGYLVVRDPRQMRRAMGQVPSATLSSMDPMTDEQMARACLAAGIFDAPLQEPAFELGVRAAEAHHQIPGTALPPISEDMTKPAESVTLSFNHDPIYRYAADKGLDYNDLCTLIHSAVDIKGQKLDAGDVGMAGMLNEDRINAQVRAERLEETLKALLEVAQTWEPEYATALDKRVLKMAQKDLNHDE